MVKVMLPNIEPSMHRQDSAMSISVVCRSQRSVARDGTNEGLDLKVLGVSTGSGLAQLNLALVRYCRKQLDAPLRIEVLQVRTSCLDNATVNH